MGRGHRRYKSDLGLASPPLPFSRSKSSDETLDISSGQSKSAWDLHTEYSPPKSSLSQSMTSLDCDGEEGILDSRLPRRPSGRRATIDVLALAGEDLSGDEVDSSSREDLDDEEVLFDEFPDRRATLGAINFPYREKVPDRHAERRITIDMLSPPCISDPASGCTPLPNPTPAILIKGHSRSYSDDIHGVTMEAQTVLSTPHSPLESTPLGSLPSSWTGSERRSSQITVTRDVHLDRVTHQFPQGTHHQAGTAAPSPDQKTHSMLNNQFKTLADNQQPLLINCQKPHSMIDNQHKNIAGNWQLPLISCQKPHSVIDNQHENVADNQQLSLISSSQKCLSGSQRDVVTDEIINEHSDSHLTFGPLGNDDTSNQGDSVIDCKISVDDLVTQWCETFKCFDMRNESHQYEASVASSPCPKVSQAGGNENKDRIHAGNAHATSTGDICTNDSDNISDCSAEISSILNDIGVTGRPSNISVDCPQREITPKLEKTSDKLDQRNNQENHLFQKSVEEKHESGASSGNYYVRTCGDSSDNLSKMPDLQQCAALPLNYVDEACHFPGTKSKALQCAVSTTRIHHPVIPSVEGDAMSNKDVVTVEVKPDLVMGIQSRKGSPESVYELVDVKPLTEMKSSSSLPVLNDHTLEYASDVYSRSGVESTEVVSILKNQSTSPACPKKRKTLRNLKTSSNTEKKGLMRQNLSKVFNLRKGKTKASYSDKNDEEKEVLEKPPSSCEDANDSVIRAEDFVVGKDAALLRKQHKPLPPLPKPPTPLVSVPRLLPLCCSVKEDAVLVHKYARIGRHFQRAHGIPPPLPAKPPHLKQLATNSSEDQHVYQNHEHSTEAPRPEAEPVLSSESEVAVETRQLTRQHVFSGPDHSKKSLPHSVRGKGLHSKCKLATTSQSEVHPPMMATPYKDANDPDGKGSSSLASKKFLHSTPTPPYLQEELYASSVQFSKSTAFPADGRLGRPHGKLFNKRQQHVERRQSRFQRSAGVGAKKLSAPFKKDVHPDSVMSKEIEVMESDVTARKIQMLKGSQPIGEWDQSLTRQDDTNLHFSESILSSSENFYRTTIHGEQSGSVTTFNPEKLRPNHKVSEVKHMNDSTAPNTSANDAVLCIAVPPCGDILKHGALGIQSVYPSMKHADPGMHSFTSGFQTKSKSKSQITGPLNTRKVQQYYASSITGKFEGLSEAVKSTYSVVPFWICQFPSKSSVWTPPSAHLQGWVMGCLLWVQTLDLCFASVNRGQGPDSI